MKTPIISLLLTVGLIGSASASMLTGSLTNGLLAYYTFDGNAYDQSGNNRDLILSYPDICTRINNSGGVNDSGSLEILTWNGRADYLPNDKPVVLTNSYSFSIWLNLSILGKNPVYIGNALSSEWMLLFDSANGGNTGLRIGDSADSAAYYNNKEVDFVNMAITINQMTTNSWFNLTAVRDDRNAYLYFNGQLVGNSNADPNYFNENAYIIGNSGGYQYPVNGLMDNIAIYDRALSALEVQQIAVPEPSTYALFGIGAIGLLIMMRRKKTA